jgi:hypothetical protein
VERSGTGWTAARMKANDTFEVILVALRDSMRESAAL